MFVSLIVVFSTSFASQTTFLVILELPIFPDCLMLPIEFSFLVDLIVSNIGAIKALTIDVKFVVWTLVPVISLSFCGKLIDFLP